MIITKSEHAIIATDICNYLSSNNDTWESPPTKSCETMRTLVDMTIKEVPSLVEMAKQCDDICLLKCAAKEIFNDGVIEWGRIMTLFALYGLVAKECEKNNMPIKKEVIIETLSKFVVEKLESWITKMGGWPTHPNQVD